MSVAQDMGFKKSKISFSDLRLRYPLSTFFEVVLGQTPLRLSGKLRYLGCPACGLSEKGSYRISVRGEKWKCFSCDKGGDIIDAAELHFGVSAPEAAKMLIGETGIPEHILNWKLKEASTPRGTACSSNAVAIKAVIGKLLDAQKSVASYDARVVAYLKGRGISESALQTAFDQKLIVTLPSTPSEAKQYLLDVVGREMLEEAGMWHKDAKAPGASYRPLAFVTTGGRSIEFRLTRAPQNEKEVRLISYGPMNPFFVAGESSDAYVITEGVTDLLSILTFGSKKSLIGLPGCNRFSPSWFGKMAGKDVMIALDADGPAYKAVHKPNGLMNVLSAANAVVSEFKFPQNFLDETPPEDHDINGLLQWRLKNMH